MILSPVAANQPDYLMQILYKWPNQWQTVDLDQVAGAGYILSGSTLSARQDKSLYIKTRVCHVPWRPNGVYVGKLHNKKNCLWGSHTSEDIDQSVCLVNTYEAINESSIKKTQRLLMPHMVNENSYQTAQMLKLLWGFVGHTLSNKFSYFAFRIPQVKFSCFKAHVLPRSVFINKREIFNKTYIRAILISRKQAKDLLIWNTKQALGLGL